MRRTRHWEGSHLWKDSAPSSLLLVLQCIQEGFIQEWDPLCQMSYKCVVCDRELHALGGLGTKGRWSKLRASFSYKEPESSIHRQSLLYYLLLPRAVLACSFKKPKQNKQSGKHISTLITPKTTYTKEGFVVLLFVCFFFKWVCD